MWKVRYYVPLLGFVVPTAVIGFGFVIPRSCIAGVNELSVGFATTILGATMTYVAGIRSATQIACPAATPWRVRLARYINRQAASPHGPLGRLLGFIWTLEHRQINRATLALLELERSHDVLDLGCGPGIAVREAAAIATGGHVLGLDVSATMVAVAARRNRDAISRCRAEVRLIDGANLELMPGSLDRALSVHSIYFWKDPQSVLNQLVRALRPGGRFVLAFRPDEPSLPARFRDPVYRFYSPAQVVAMLERAGFSQIRQEREASKPVVRIVAQR